MDGPKDIILSEVRQTVQDKYHDITYIWNLKRNEYKQTYLQNRNRLTDIENKLMDTKVESRGIN